MTRRSTLSAWMTGKHWPWLMAALAVALTLPALAVGRQLDDDLLFESLRTAPNAGAAVNGLFVLMDGNAEHARAQMLSGAFPWWSLPEARVAFWRPAAALTHWLDFRLWPEQPALMHAHSLLAFGLLVAAAALLYQTLYTNQARPAWVAGLAALLYAVDDGHGFGAGWLANRNGGLAALWAVLALSAHVRWRRAGWRPGAWLGPALLLLAQLSNEGAAAALGYWVAYAVFIEQGAWRQRLAALLPALAVTAAWRVAYAAQGYGVWGATYVDPGREPLAFLQAALAHGPGLLLGQGLLPPAEVAPFLSAAAQSGLWVAAVVVLGVIAWWLRPVLQRSATARFWASGMLLSLLLPAGGALPANRLLFLAGLGGMGLLAEGLAAPRSPHVWRRGVRGALLVVHLVFAPLLLPVTAYSPALLGGLAAASASLPNVPALTTQTVIVVNAPSFAHAGYLSRLRTQQGLFAPARVRGLATGLVAVTITRTDDATLTITPADGFITGFDGVFRGPAHPLAAGAVVDLGDMQVTVLALTADGRPATAAFHFAAPLEDTALRWVTWQSGVYVPWTPPAVGQTVTLAGLWSNAP